MPKATVSQETVKKELKSCEGGFVTLKKLPFGLLLERRDNASKLSMHGGDDKVDIALMQRWSRQFEFGHCIIDHNLEDDNGAKLDFNNEMSIYALDPKIGQEIERYLDELNQEDTPEDQANFTSAANGLSKDTATSKDSTKTTLS